MRLSHPPFRADALRSALIFAALFFVIVGLAPAVTFAQTTLPVWFDDDADPTVQGFPIGWGTFTYNGPATDGVWTASDVGGVSFAFNVLGSTFTQDDSLHSLDNTLFEFTTTPFGRRIQFSDSGSGAGGFGSGSLDLMNAGGDVLSFEPSWYGGGLQLFATYNSFTTAFGNYYIGAASVPEPGAIPFALLAGGGIYSRLLLRKRKR